MSMLLVWCVQTAALIAAGALLAPFLKAALARLWFWQGLIILALLLPLVEPWRIPPPELLTSGRFIATTSLTAELLDSAPVPFWMRIGWIDILIAGACLRLLWLACGLWRLHRLRKYAERIVPPIVTYGTTIEWFVSDRVTGPVTFGWLRPSILLPAHVCAMPGGMQRAVAWHELLHVERRDWLFVLAEEIVRSALWFHPAIWYALSQVQLAREQAVDDAVVAATRDRSVYLEALVAVAAQNVGADLAPAPLFLKKRQLAVRVASILKEAPMSKSKLAVRAVFVCGAVIAAIASLAALFPFKSEAQSLPDSPGITVDSGAPLAHRGPLRIPAGVTATGMVIADATLSSKGTVTDVRVVSGSEDLRKAVLTSVLDWHYASQPAPPATVRITITFAQPSVPVQQGVLTAAPPPPPPPPPPPSPQQVRVAGGRSGGPLRVGVVGGPLPVPPPPPFKFDHIRYIGFGPALEQEVRQKLAISEGQTVNMTAEELVAAVRAIDEHLTPLIWRGSLGDLSLDIRLPSVVTASSLTQIDIPAGTPRLSNNVAGPALITKIPPVYPVLAKAARTQGTVKLDVLIGPDGHVQGINVLDGPPLLQQAAMDAVSQWVYKPILLNGQPTTVVTNVEINFALMN